MRPGLVVLLCAFTTLQVRADAPIRGAAKVVDGDSLEVAGARIRLWGIDAPEYTQTCTREQRPWKCGKAATRALRQRLSGETVSCVAIDTDAHGRAVSRCEVDGRSLNEWLVREGWALDYRRYSKGRYTGAEQSARAARRGIWAGEFENPEALRRRHQRPR